MRSLPAHSILEGEQLDATLTALLRKCLYNEQPPKVSDYYIIDEFSRRLKKWRSDRNRYRIDRFISRLTNRLQIS